MGYYFVNEHPQSFYPFGINSAQRQNADDRSATGIPNVPDSGDQNARINKLNRR